MLDLILARELYSFNTLLILMVTTEQNLDLQKLKFLAFCALIQAFNYLFAPCRGIGESGLRIPRNCLRYPGSGKILLVK